MNKELSILVIDDDEVDRMSVCRALSKIELPINVLEAFNYNEAIICLEKYEFDCIFLDYRLPGKNGLVVILHVCVLQFLPLPQ
ncbi:MAG: response regulator [Cyanobacteria bacterium J06639_18]